MHMIWQDRVPVKFELLQFLREPGIVNQKAGEDWFLKIRVAISSDGGDRIDHAQPVDPFRGRVMKPGENGAHGAPWAILTCISIS